MKLNIHRHLPIALLLSAVSTPVLAQSATSIHAARINSANELVRSGEFAQAIENYREIPVTDLTQDELNYNSGVALYRQGEVDQARALFSETSTSTNNSLAAAARYNLGNCSYTDAVATAEQDKQSAIDSLNQAITQYRASLRANPKHVDARANIELAVALRKKLEDELKQEQQQEQQDKQDQQQEQKSEQQESDSEKSESEQDQESEQSPSEDSESDSSEEQDDSQSSADENSKSAEQPDEESEQQADGQPNDKESDESKSSESESLSATNEQSEQQTQPSSQDDNSKPQSAQDSQSAQESAADDPSERKDDVIPSGELKSASEQHQNEGPQGTVNVPSGDEELMTREEALKMLQSVRDRDMLRRLRQEQAERSRHVPTDRDW